MTTTLRSAALLGCGLFLTAAVGCGGDDTKNQIAAMNTSNAKRLANLYAGHQNMKNGTGPKDEAEFKEFIRGFAPDKLSAMGVDTGNLDKVFTSERDGKPFKIRYKVGGGRGAVAPVVFETGGQNGKKQVAFTGGNVEECDDSTYQMYLAGKTPAGAPTAPPAGPPGGGVGGRPGGGGRPAGAPTGPPG